LSALNAVKVSRPSSISRLIKIFTLAKSPTHAPIVPRLSPTLPVDTTIESGTMAMCSPGAITVTRTKRADFFNYLLDSRRMDLLQFPRTLARIFYSSSIPHLYDSFRQIPQHLYPFRTHLTTTAYISQHCIANHACIDFSLPLSLFFQSCFLYASFLGSWVLRGFSGADTRTL